MRILIADDETLSRETLKLILQDFGPCDTAVNGKDAYSAFVKAYKDAEPYRLVCLDIVMPVIDGIGCLTRMREYEENLGIAPKDQAKIVVVTVMGDPAHVFDSFYSLCDGYLVKPTDATKITELLEKLE